MMHNLNLPTCPFCHERITAVTEDEYIEELIVEFKCGAVFNSGELVRRDKNPYFDLEHDGIDCLKRQLKIAKGECI